MFIVSELKYTMAAQGQALRGNTALGQALRGNTDRIRGGKIYNRSLEANTKGKAKITVRITPLPLPLPLFLKPENIFAI